MCGRYTIVASAEELEKRFKAQMEIAYEPQYNAPPTREMPIIPSSAPDAIVPARFGLLPGWVKEPKTSYSMFNARSEEIETTSSYKGLIFTQRCLVLADGFYEWKTIDKKTKIPYRFTIDEKGSPFAFAGLWTVWNNQIASFTILTTAATDAMQGVHDRMPRILKPEEEAFWLNVKADKQLVRDFIQATPDVNLVMREANPLVGNVRNQGPELLNSK